MELIHSRLPTDEMTKSIYDDTDTTYKCITLFEYRPILATNL